MVILLMSPLFLGYIVAVVMAIHFLVMVGIWATVFINFNGKGKLLFSIKSAIVWMCTKLTIYLYIFLESYCGPCPKNWICYRNSCYQFSNESKNWYQSKASCQSQNSSLLKIYSKVDQDFFKFMKSYHWMGLEQIPENRSWHWEDVSVLSPDQLSMVEMQNGTCAVYASSFKGYTENCSTPNTYICMQQPI
ncbi:NKG2-D type II integral membrane protein [Heterocephalus glaber]|uniref:NKG2-D type II integral membrane protein n=2 Tax=Heterocephalus glaber TaxID=10181 RepID=A0AAX6SWW7_HETGA|nr:NKG2-D type II integral membrane protein [Heterocephalus glaber]